jgi:hypothetical protein
VPRIIPQCFVDQAIGVLEVSSRCGPLARLPQCGAALLPQLEKLLVQGVGILGRQKPVGRKSRQEQQLPPRARKDDPVFDPLSHPLATRCAVPFGKGLEPLPPGQPVAVVPDG